MPHEPTTTAPISLQDIVAATAEGALRALDARKIGASELIKSGFMVDIIIRAGGRPLLPAVAGKIEE